MQHHHHGGRGVSVSVAPAEPEYEYGKEERERGYVVGRERGERVERERERERGDASNENGNGNVVVGGSGSGSGSGRLSPDLLKQKHKKITVACNFCRCASLIYLTSVYHSRLCLPSLFSLTARKLKCDGGRPSCSQCVKRTQSCDYKPHSRRRGGVPRETREVKEARGVAQDVRSDGEGEASGDVDAEYNGSSGEDGVVNGGGSARFARERESGGRGGVFGQGVQRRSGSAGAGAGVSRRSSNVDLMIAETLLSPRAAAREERMLAERERDRDYVYAAATAAAVHAGANGNGSGPQSA
ncbi:hypothetical protein EW145_g8598, partial [Phellinidium pouzarii]